MQATKSGVRRSWAGTVFRRMWLWHNQGSNISSSTVAYEISVGFFLCGVIAHRTVNAFVPEISPTNLGLHLSSLTFFSHQMSMTTTTTATTSWITVTCTTPGCCGPAIPTPNEHGREVVAMQQTEKSNSISRLIPAPTALVLQELFQTVLHIPSNLSQLVSAIWLHFSYQPKKPLWNIQQTVVMAILQALRDHSLTNSLEFWRVMLIFPTWLRPLTSKTQDGSFRVHPRNLRGILQQLDKNEDGSRILDAEWMSAGTIWNRCQSIFSGKKKLEDFDLEEQEQIQRICQHRNEGTTAVVPRARSPEKIVLYFHGGAYCAMSAQSHRTLTHKISRATGRRIFGKLYFVFMYTMSSYLIWNTYRGWVST